MRPSTGGDGVLGRVRVGLLRIAHVAHLSLVERFYDNKIGIWGRHLAPLPKNNKKKKTHFNLQVIVWITYLLIAQAF